MTSNFFDFTKTTKVKFYPLVLIFLTVLISFSSCKDDDDEDPIVFPDKVTVTFENLKPEGIDYNKNNTTFLLGSLTMGDVQEVDFEGNYTNFTNDADLLASAGIHVDYEGDRLLVTSIDPGAFGGAKSVGGINVYKLSTKEKIKEVSFLDLLPDAEFFTPNDIAVDANGNIYVTDFLGDVIYKVDTDYNATVFSSSTTLNGPNGIDYHPDGYLLVSNLRAGQLLKVPTNNPTVMSIVTIESDLFSGMDGIVYKPDGKLVGVTSFETLVEISSNDNWVSATVDNSKPLTTPGTTVAVTPEGLNFALLTDVASQAVFTDWVIEQVSF